VCTPFPNAIPAEIVLNQFDHRYSYLGDQGMVWAPRRGMVFPDWAMEPAATAKITEPDVVKVGPHGYIHGWILVGVPGVGAMVRHPEHGHGRVTKVTPKRAMVDFDSGARHAFEHGGPTGVLPGHFVVRAPKAMPSKAVKPKTPKALTTAQRDLGAVLPSERPHAAGYTHHPNPRQLDLLDQELRFNRADRLITEATSAADLHAALDHLDLPDLRDFASQHGLDVPSDATLGSARRLVVEHMRLPDRHGAALAAVPHAGGRPKGKAMNRVAAAQFLHHVHTHEMEDHTHQWRSCRRWSRTGRSPRPGRGMSCSGCGTRCRNATAVSGRRCWRRRTG